MPYAMPKQQQTLFYYLAAILFRLLRIEWNGCAPLWHKTQFLITSNVFVSCCLLSPTLAYRDVFPQQPSIWGAIRRAVGITPQ